MTGVHARLRDWARAPLATAQRLRRRITYAGSRRSCPVCGTSSRCFLPYGIVPRAGAMCPHCGALERHRFVWLYFAQRTNLFDARPKRLLHIAPEPCFRNRLARHIGAGYVTADMHRGGVVETMDMVNIPHPDRSFDVVYCSHVMEHVPDDRRAMRECARVLEPSNGWAILLVPITAERTDEDPSITDAAERLRRFGQGDHVRRYGPDYVDRLRDAGFVVEVVRVADLVAPSAAVHMGLTAAAGELYHCRRA